MNNKFDELTKNLAQSVTRRAALKKFGVGIAGMALACFGLARKSEANEICNACKRNCLAAGGSATYCDYACAMACWKKN